jgi:hypothetical protein
MKILLITYNIDLTPIKEATLRIELQGASAWWHYLPNTWLIKTDKPPQYWHNKIAPIMQNTDRLLIIEVTNNYFGWLSKDAWDWFEKAFRP